MCIFFKAKSKGGIIHQITAMSMDNSSHIHLSAWPLLIGLAYSMFQVQVASISASGDFCVFVIVVTVSALAWIFNDKIEALLGLEYLKLLRSSKPVSRKINARGLASETDPMRLPVTVVMILLTANNWQKKYVETDPYFMLLAVFLRLYMVGEMWTRGMPRIFRWFFDFEIRTNYFEPFLLLLEMGFVTHRTLVIYEMAFVVLGPWGFISLNPDTHMACLITWSAVVSYILVSRYGTPWSFILSIQVSDSIMLLPSI